MMYAVVAVIAACGGALIGFLIGGILGGGKREDLERTLKARDIQIARANENNAVLSKEIEALKGMLDRHRDNSYTRLAMLHQIARLVAVYVKPEEGGEE
jgi:hypothetical protein